MDGMQVGPINAANRSKVFLTQVFTRFGFSSQSSLN